MTDSAKPYLTLDDVDVDGKTVLVRFDINSPIVNGRIAGTDRLEAASETLKALAARNAKTVILGHQGRKDEPDFTSLKEHAEKLEELADVRVHFVEDVAGDKALAAIGGLAAGEALMLENVRGLDDETRKVDRAEHARADFVQRLADAADVYVNDAFSAAHRSQASLVGFAELVPSVAGPTMDRELTALAKAVDDPEEPAVYFLGGAKPEDSIQVMRSNFERGTLTTALLGGVVANLFLHARGHDLGHQSMEYLDKKGFLKLLPEVEDLLEQYDAGIVTPIDLAVRGPNGDRNVIWVEDLPQKAPIFDIGDETVTEYREEILQAGSLMMNGPAGLYEEESFSHGTKGILAAFKESEAFSLLGGGHTLTAIGEFGFKHEDFGYVSLAGGALMAYLTGKELPVVEALKASARKFRNEAAA